MSTPLTTGILGAGRIASGFGTPEDELPLSLAHAVTLTQGLELGGFFDISEESALAAEEKWSCPSSPRTREAWFAKEWDVIYIATPDAQHAGDLKDILSLSKPPRAVLVEKPLCTDFSCGEQLLQLAHDKGVALQVNYPRRWQPDLCRLKQRVQASEFGQLRRFRVCCSGGLLHNGSHAVDLLADWLPADFLTQHSYHGDGLLMGDDDYSVEIIMAKAVQDDCYLWEVEADFDLARISISGIPETLLVETKREHPEFEGFHGLFSEGQTNLQKSPLMLYSSANLVRLANDHEAAQNQHALEISRQRLIASLFHHHS